MTMGKSLLVVASLRPAVCVARLPASAVAHVHTPCFVVPSKNFLENREGCTPGLRGICLDQMEEDGRRGIRGAAKLTIGFASDL